MQRGGTAVMSVTPTAAPEPTWYGVAAGGVMFLFGLFGCAATGLAAAVASESDAMMISYFGVPLAFGGVVAPIVAAFLRRQPLGVAIGVPVGCGCATIMAGVVGMVVFFTAIWPSL
jgi:hypothetical protein